MQAPFIISPETGIVTLGEYELALLSSVLGEAVSVTLPLVEARALIEKASECAKDFSDPLLGGLATSMLEQLRQELQEVPVS